MNREKQLPVQVAHPEQPALGRATLFLQVLRAAGRVGLVRGKGARSDPTPLAEREAPPTHARSELRQELRAPLWGEAAICGPSCRAAARPEQPGSEPAPAGATVRRGPGAEAARGGSARAFGTYRRTPAPLRSLPAGALLRPCDCLLVLRASLGPSSGTENPDFLLHFVMCRNLLMRHTLV